MKKKRIIISLISLLLAIVIVVFVRIKTSASTQILISVLSFSEHSLKSPEYLLYDVDIMNLFQDYMNGDVSYEGSAYFSHIKNFNFSSNGSIKGERSCSQRKMSCESQMSVVFEDLGNINLYAQDKTIFLNIPLLEEKPTYAFDTGIDLFRKGPSFTSDIDRKWFHENAGNIVDFLHSIQIEKTGQEYIDEDGTASYEYKMSIPKGEGQFIWDLLGVDAPDKDIVASLYLDRRYHTHRILFNLDDFESGSTLELCGSNLGTMIMTIMLPEQEKAVLTVSRDSTIKHTNSYDASVVYFANNNTDYTLTSHISMEKDEKGVSGKVSDINLSTAHETLLTGYIEGKLEKKDSIPDVFDGVNIDFSAVDSIDWKIIRDDAESFINEVLSNSQKELFVSSLYKKKDFT